MGFIGRSVRVLIIAIIRLYQLIVSPYTKPCCRFYPTCSTYAIDALKHYGVIQGLWLAVKRIVRCHPWALGGYDPVYEFKPAKFPSPFIKPKEKKEN